ncbi:MAG: tetratricopeptide repeat protein [Ferruginibacter sp.]
MSNESNRQVLKDKIDGLNKQAWESRVSDSNQAHIFCNQAIEIAEEINYSRGKAEGYRTAAFCLIRLSKHQEALEYCKRSFPLFESLNDVDGQASIYGYQGIIQRSLGNYAASLELLFKFLELSKQVGNMEAASLAYYHSGVTYKYLGSNEKALNYFLQSLQTSPTQSTTNWVAQSYSFKQIGLIYFETGDFTNALQYFQKSLGPAQDAGDKWGEAGCMDCIGNLYFKLEKFDTAIEYYKKSLEISVLEGDKKGQGNTLYHLTQISLENKEPAQAALYAKESLQIREEARDKKGQAELYLLSADITAALSKEDSGEKRLSILKKALLIGEETKALDLLCNVHSAMYNTYKEFHQYSEALQHLEKSYAFEKELHSNKLKQQMINLEITHRVEQTRTETEALKLRNIELSGLYEEIKNQKEKADITLSELKAAQAQLIQSEKMASLGELTAGIAHEIQNPLNFVNNFSEVNTELIQELVDEVDKGNLTEVKAIANDIKDNEEKINHHGKRADAIVKGMLQHSRSSNGIKEPTDINALCDEYLRLSYHGLRAKDKLFNATLKTDFDVSIQKINIISQDIGRVILNLLTNAFYAVNEKKKACQAELVEAGYEPRVTISTNCSPLLRRGIAGEVSITVTDNGKGIPQKILEKIFQPFFTTKPTGQGTGLGLSLSYDIIKAHGGEIKVESKENEGTTFTIQLPTT